MLPAERGVMQVDFDEASRKYVACLQLFCWKPGPIVPCLCGHRVLVALQLSKNGRSWRPKPIGETHRPCEVRSAIQKDKIDKILFALNQLREIHWQGLAPSLPSHGL